MARKAIFSSTILCLHLSPSSNYRFAEWSFIKLFWGLLFCCSFQILQEGVPGSDYYLKLAMLRFHFLNTLSHMDPTRSPHGLVKPRSWWTAMRPSQRSATRQWTNDTLHPWQWTMKHYIPIYIDVYDAELFQVHPCSMSHFQSGFTSEKELGQWRGFWSGNWEQLLKTDQFNKNASMMVSLKGNKLTGWWFGCHILCSQKYWVANHPNWLSYFSEGWPNHQPGNYHRNPCVSWADWECLSQINWLAEFVTVDVRSWQTGQSRPILDEFNLILCNSAISPGLWWFPKLGVPLNSSIIHWNRHFP